MLNWLNSLLLRSEDNFAVVIDQSRLTCSFPTFSFSRIPRWQPTSEQKAARRLPDFPVLLRRQLADHLPFAGSLNASCRHRCLEQSVTRYFFALFIPQYVHAAHRQGCDRCTAAPSWPTEWLGNEHKFNLFSHLSICGVDAGWMRGFVLYILPHVNICSIDFKNKNCRLSILIVFKTFGGKT